MGSKRGPAQIGRCLPGSRAAIRRKLSRLKELYVNEMIDLEEYRRDYELYTAPAAEEERPNFEAVEAILANGFRKIYDGLEREEKRTLWRSVIKEIRVDKERQITGIAFFIGILILGLV